MKPSHLFLILCLSQAALAQAQIYKRVDADGHVTYSSEPIKGSKKLYLKPLPTMNGGNRESRRSTPEDFPRVDSETQKRRDDTRRAILQDELASEEANLTTAQENLKSIVSNPVPLVGPNGLPFQGTEKYAEDLKAAQEQVALHEQNVRALKTEISNLR